jgi:hypothetical protein
MRGFQHPAVRQTPDAAQESFGRLSRHRRAKLAQAAHTTLVKAHQWSRGQHVAEPVATALESAVKQLSAKQPNKPAGAKS